MQGAETFPKELILTLAGNQSMGNAEGEGQIGVIAGVEQSLCWTNENFLFSTRQGSGVPDKLQKYVCLSYIKVGRLFVLCGWAGWKCP